MANLGDVFKKEVTTKKQHPSRKTVWIHYKKLKQSKYQYRKRDYEVVRDFADFVKVDGQILQDLLIRKIDVDEYEIIAGHKRHAAAALLTEEDGLPGYEFLPCVIREGNEIRTRFSVISTNNFDEKSPYEIMHEIEEAAYLLEHFPEEFPDLPEKGRMIEKLAQLLNKKKSTVGEYLDIANKLGDDGMKAFAEGSIKKSAAVTLATLSEEEQEEILAEGITTNVEIKKHIQAKTEMPEPQTISSEEEYSGQLVIVNEDMEVDEEQIVDDEVTEVSSINAKVKQSSEREIASKSCTEFRYRVEIPLLKNMEQREDFLRAYKDWPVWTMNELTEETFYRVDLLDGSYIVARHYPYSSYWGNHEMYEGCTYYLITDDVKFFKDGESNMTQLKDHLKNVLRK